MIKYQIDNKTKKKLEKVLSKNKAYASTTFIIELKKMLAEATGRAKIKSPIDTGNLRSSIGYDVISRKNLTFRALADYASFLEFGTRRHKAQPYFFGSLDKAKQNMMRRINKALKQLNK